MTQEQKDAIKLAGQTKYPSKGHEAAVKRLHFSWGCTHVINHAAQFGLVDSIKADTVLHVGLAQLETENTDLYLKVKNLEFVETVDGDCIESQSNEIDELKAWKESALRELNAIDLQLLGKKLGIGLGQSVSENVHSKIDGLLERVRELEALLKTWVKQNNYLRRHSISDFDDVHNQTKKALK